MHRKRFLNIFPSERMTRFFSSHDPSEVFARITLTLDKFLVPYKVHQKIAKIAFSTVDKRKCQLHGEISIQRFNDEYHLINFRKSKVRIWSYILFRLG